MFRARVAAKLGFYTRHPENLCCLVIDQKKVRVEVHAKAEGWRKRVLTDLHTVLRIDDFGFECRIVDLYEGTPLARR